MFLNWSAMKASLVKSLEDIITSESYEKKYEKFYDVRKC